jgi:hypothetical protein
MKGHDRDHRRRGIDLSGRRGSWRGSRSEWRWRGELDTIAAVVIGGGSLSCGRGSILGSLIGALIMQVPQSGPGDRDRAIIVTAVNLDRLARALTTRPDGSLWKFSEPKFAAGATPVFRVSSIEWRQIDR